MLTFFSVYLSIRQMVLDKLISREKRLANRKRDAEILAELRKPQEDLNIVENCSGEVPAVDAEYPRLSRVPNMKLTGQAFADLLMVFEFLHNFGETLGFGELENDKLKEK